MDDFDKDTQVFPSDPPQMDQVHTREEDIVFEHHPDGCGTLVYVSPTYLVTIGGAACNCVQPNALRICDTSLFLESTKDPKIWVDKAFSTMDDAKAYARKWVAHNHTRAIAFYRSMVSRAQEAFDRGDITMFEARTGLLAGQFANEDERYPTDPVTGERVHALTQDQLATVNRLTETEDMSVEAPGQPTPIVRSTPDVPAPIFEDKMPEFPSDTDNAPSTEFVFSYPVFHLGKGKA